MPSAVDRLRAAGKMPNVDLPEGGVLPIRDLERVMALPQRAPVDCDAQNGLYTPATQALVEVMTERFSLGERQCDCMKKFGLPCIKVLNAMQAWSLREMRLAGGLVARAAVGAGKCVGADTEVFDLAAGKRRLVTESGSIVVPSFDGKFTVAKRGEVFPSGSKPCVKLALADGSSMVLSLDHKVYTHRGWVEAGVLTKEDFVAVPTFAPAPEKHTEASDDEVSLVALLLSDGGCSQGTVYFTNATPVVVEEFIRLSEALCHGAVESKSKSKARQFRLKGSQGWRQNGQHGTGFRDKWDLYGLAKEKRVTASVWGLPSRQVALFLNRFWACDGHVSKNNLECTLASEKLVDDLRFLMLRLGVRSRKKYKASSCNGKAFPSWRITIYGPDALRFLNEVGDVLGKEAACQALRKKLEAARRNTNFDIVPLSRKEIREICDEIGLVKRCGYTGSLERTNVIRGHFQATDGQFVSREKFNGFAKKYAYEGRYSHLASDDIAWERVVDLTDAGVQPVYDLSVPETHNFFANGMLVHNTITGILAPLAFTDCREAVIFIEPGQRQQYKLTYMRLREHFRVPSLLFHDDEAEGYIVEGAPTLRVITYSRLSRGAATNLLGPKIQPDVIIADEGHRLANRKSSQTGRFLRYMEQFGDRTRFCVWSGTLVKKSICDQSHLSAHALGEGSPMPIDMDEMEAWGLVIDESNRADCTSALAETLYQTFGGTRPPSNAREWLIRTAQTKLREGYQRRVSSTLGIVSTSGGSVGASIYLREKAVPKLPPEVRAALDGVRTDGVRPDGEVLVEEIDRFRCASEIACGFYYRWVFPRGEPIELIKRWFAARKAWNKELREKLIYAEEHLDSPMLCARAAERAWRDVPYEGDLPVWRADSWPEWAAVKDLVYHESRPVWIDEFMAQDAAEWAMKNKGVVWYMSDAFGRKVAQLANLPCHGGGPDSEKNLLAEKGDRSVICSFKAHGSGRDGLQRLFNEQYYPQFPTSGNLWEQGLGRLHRQGQEADEVISWVPLHVAENRDAIDKAIREAEFIQQVTGNVQKLVLADKDFL